MKNTLKLIGFIALTALIGFSFAACKHSSDPEDPGTNVFWSMDEVSAYLSTAAGGSNPTNAIPLAVNIYLGTMTDASSAWRQLLSALEATGKLVKLDLSESSFYGTEFNPDNSVSTGKEYIVSFILPNTAKSITNVPKFATFRYFSNLAYCSGANVISIGDGAFADCVLQSVSFPAAENIGESAFECCTALESVSFPAVKSIGGEAFIECTVLKSVSFPLATSIGEDAFTFCTALESVSFPAVMSIDFDAFACCTALQSVSFPAAASIGDCVFAGCTSLTSFTLSGSGPLSVIENGKVLVRNNTELLAYPSASGSITLTTITSIGCAAFTGCTALKNASFPEAESIGVDAFADCTALQSASFPAAESINECAFAGCTSLESVNIPAITSIGKDAFDDTGSTSLNITMGSAAPTLGAYIFYDVKTIKPVTVRVPSGATGYDPAWQNAFTGGNSYINLSIVEY